MKDSDSGDRDDHRHEPPPRRRQLGRQLLPLLPPQEELQVNIVIIFQKVWPFYHLTKNISGMLKWTSFGDRNWRLVKLIPGRPRGVCSPARSCPPRPALAWQGTAWPGTTRRRLSLTVTTVRPAFSEEPPWLSPGNDQNRPKRR